RVVRVDAQRGGCHPVSENDPDADGLLTERDLGFAEPLLPSIAGFVRRYFRASVVGLERIPPDQPVLFVGNHSGGTPSPDSVAFILSYIARFGIARPLYWLAHSLVMSAPGLGRFLRRCGVLPASPGTARAVLEGGGSLVVYPGGEVELHRPWTARNEIRFLGH